MPLYSFECQNCDEKWDAFFSMKAKKESDCSKCGKPGLRVFVNPNVSLDTKLDPWDINKQVRKTGQIKNPNMGQLWDIAAEMSEKRGGENDPIRKKAEADYAKTRKGKKYRKPGASVDISFNS